MVKNVVKLTSLGFIFVVLAVGIIYGIGYWKYQNNPEYRAEQKLKELEEKYAKDPYGGETPEETLRLFIDALKKGDTDSAAKYFILDKQDEWKEDLAKIKEKNLLGEMIRDLENAKKYRSSGEEQVFFTSGNEAGEATANIDIIKVIHKWKIRGI